MYVGVILMVFGYTEFAFKVLVLYFGKVKILTVFTHTVRAFVFIAFTLKIKINMYLFHICKIQIKKKYSRHNNVLKMAS